MVLPNRYSRSLSDRLPMTIPSASTSLTIQGFTAASTQPASATADSILSGELAPGWQIREPIFVRIEIDEDGRFLASDYISVVYGDGETAAAALNDYKQSLIEYYNLTAAEEAEGDPFAKEQMAQFRRHLVASS